MPRDLEKNDPRRLRSTTRVNQSRLERAEKQLKRVVEKVAGEGANSAQAQSVAAEEGKVRAVKKIQKKEDKAKFQARKAGSDAPASNGRKKISLPQIGKGRPPKSKSPDFNRVNFKGPKYSSGKSKGLRVGFKGRVDEMLQKMNCKKGSC
jgi:uncharacterized membrane protein